MPKARYAAVALLALLTCGSLLVTGGYAWYYRSAAYRNICANRLSAALGLPAEIGQIIPRSRHSREFRDVRVWLPERRGEAAFCEQATCTLTPTADDPRAFELALRGGRCELSTRTWVHQDYRRVLESGLRPGFDPNGPRRVVFSGMDLSFERRPFRIRLDDASGVVRFDDPVRAQATATCNHLNGHSVGTVTLHAEYSPAATGVRLDRVTLIVPEIPLSALGLPELLGMGPQTGRFSGRLGYREPAGHRELTASGRIFDVQLSECTAGLLPQPWHGSIPEMELEELTVVNDRPQRVRFRGTIRDAVLGDWLAPLGLSAVGGGLVLRVHEADISSAGIERLTASGTCEGIALEQLTTALGWGRMSGTAHVAIDDLTIVNNRVASLNATLKVTPGEEGAPGWIERPLLIEAVRRTLGVELPNLLVPERIEYSALGVRLEMKDELLYVFGTHGPREKTILTVQIAGRAIPIVSEPKEPIDVHKSLDEARTRIAAEIEQHLQRLRPVHPWVGDFALPFSLGGPLASSPATATRPAVAPVPE